jgi:hypothetical protein
MENGKPKAPLILFMISCGHFTASIVFLIAGIITLHGILNTEWHLSLLGLIAMAFVQSVVLLFSLSGLFGTSFVSAVLSLLSAKKDPGRFRIPGTVISIISSALCVLSFLSIVGIMFFIK